MIAYSNLLIHKMAAPLKAPATLYTQVLQPATRICACYSNLLLCKMAPSNLASVILCGCLLVPKIDIMTAFRPRGPQNGRLLEAPATLYIQVLPSYKNLRRMHSNLLLRKMAVFEIPLFQ
jgi:hypothetical protein